MMGTLSDFGLVLVSLIVIWGVCLVVAFISYGVSMIFLFTASVMLLREVRKISPQTFDYLHRGDINSALGVVPYVTTSEHLGEFLYSDQMNEIPVIENAKKKYLCSLENVDKNFARVGIIVLIGIGATFAIILTPLSGAIFAHRYMVYPKGAASTCSASLCGTKTFEIVN